MSALGGLLERASTDRALASRVLGQWQVVERHASPGERDDHVAKPELDLLVAVRDLREQPARCIGSLCERLALRHRHAEIESVEVHPLNYLPVGELLSTPQVNIGVYRRVNEQAYPAVMDIHDMRRAIVANLIGTKVASKAEFARVTGLAPSYVTRMLSPPGTEGHKRIGEDLCLTLEAVPELELAPGQLLDPKPIERATPPDMADITPSEWGHLQNMRDTSDEDKEFLMNEALERAQRFRAVRKQVLASVGIHGEADAKSVTKALGSVLKDGPQPPNESRRVKIRREAPKQLDSRRKAPAVRASKVK